MDVGRSSIKRLNAVVLGDVHAFRESSASIFEWILHHLPKAGCLECRTCIKPDHD